MARSNFLCLSIICPDAYEELVKAERDYALHDDIKSSIDHMQQALMGITNAIIVFEDLQESLLECTLDEKLNRILINYIRKDYRFLMNEIKSKRNGTRYRNQKLDKSILYYFGSMFTIVSWFCYTYDSSIVLPKEFINPKILYDQLNQETEKISITDGIKELTFSSADKTNALIKIKSYLSLEPNELRKARSHEIMTYLDPVVTRFVRYFEAEASEEQNFENITINFNKFIRNETIINQTYHNYEDKAVEPILKNHEIPKKSSGFKTLIIILFGIIMGLLVYDILITKGTLSNNTPTSSSLTNSEVTPSSNIVTIVTPTSKPISSPTIVPSSSENQITLPATVDNQITTPSPAANQIIIPMPSDPTPTTMLTPSPTPSPSIVPFTDPTPTILPTSPYSLKWEQKADSGICTSLVTANGVIYYGDSLGYIYAINISSGDLVWKSEIGTDLSFSLYIKDSSLFCCSPRKGIFSIDINTGNINWTFDYDDEYSQSGFSDIVLVGDVIVFGAQYYLYGIDADYGIRNWKNYKAYPYVRWPQVDKDNNIIYTSEYGHICGIDPLSNQVVFNETDDAYIDNQVDYFFVRNDILYTSGDENFFAYDLRRNSYVWKKEFDYDLTAIDLIDDKLVLKSGDGYLFSIDKNSGDIKWVLKLESNITGKPLLYDSDLYIGDELGYIYCINNETGKKKWSYKTGNQILCKPIIDNGILYFGSGDRYLYALDLRN